MSMLAITWKYYQQEKAARREAKEKAAIAKAFNDRYCYRFIYDSSDTTLVPGVGMYGKSRGGYRWMCPQCNKLHRPIEIDIFVGLHYPKCCDTPQGHRVNCGIRYK